MIIVKQNGGIGNQLFIYATAYSIYREYGIDIVFDDINYVMEAYREYDIDKYNVVLKDRFLKPNKIHKKYLLRKLSKLIYFIRYKCKIHKLNAIPVVEKNHELITFAFNRNRNYYLDGYWQSHNYFHKYRDELIKQFVIKHVSTETIKIADKIQQSNYCAIHVRRGDYIRYYGGSTLDMSYYKSAIQLIEGFYPDMNFIVFSDDVDFCKDMFGEFSKFEYISGKSLTDKEELYLMTKCKHYIIANSTFSWWGAYLGYDEQSKVICPVVGMWKDSFYVDEWIKIPTKFSKTTNDKCSA